MFTSTRSGFIGLVLAITASIVAGPVAADNRVDIEAKSQTSLTLLRKHYTDIDKLLRKAAGVLVFPEMVNMGFGGGGEYGEGVLRIGDKAAAYYASAGAAFDRPMASKSKAQVIVFMTEQSLIDFRNSVSWDVDGNNPIKLMDLKSQQGERQHPVLAFIYSEQGFLESHSLDGTSIRRIAR